MLEKNAQIVYESRCPGECLAGKTSPCPRFFNGFLGSANRSAGANGYLSLEDAAYTLTASPLDMP